jgi:hypothetical protein
MDPSRTAPSISKQDKGEKGTNIKSVVRTLNRVSRKPVCYLAFVSKSYLCITIITGACVSPKSYSFITTLN